MEGTKEQKSGTAAEVREDEPQFSGEQLADCGRYCNHRDLVEALLEKDKKYTKKEIDEQINRYMKGKVK